MPTFESIIGLEIHAELKTRTKMFCDSLNDPMASRPNVNICPICLGHPGTLPVPNRNAIEKVIAVGLALQGNICEQTSFDRKNYFYPDLPKGYQISQYEHPIVSDGWLDIPLPSGEMKRIRIRRIHLEEDTGRSIHDPNSKTTLLDFNRAGIPLLELVTEPDFANGGEARAFAESFRQILQYLDASDADMEKGQMRIEANVSLRVPGSTTLGAKVELKNINSFRFVEHAIAAEVARQTDILLRGGTIIQETRGWDEANGTTVPQRLKEGAQDYRYFPEPDIPPIRIAADWVCTIQRSLPELPQAKYKRFVREFGIEDAIARNLTNNRRLAGFFEAVASELLRWLKDDGKDPRELGPLQLAANYLSTDVVKLAADTKIPVGDSPMTPENFAELIAYLASDRISSKAAKETLAEMYRHGTDPSIFLTERNLWQISDANTIHEAVDAIIETHTKAVNDYRIGKTAALQFLVGQVMRRLRGGNPDTVRKVLEKKLK